MNKGPVIARSLLDVLSNILDWRPHPMVMFRGFNFTRGLDLNMD